jgi:hypothetical protein
MGSQSVEDSEETAGARTTNSTGMLPPLYSIRNAGNFEKERAEGVTRDQTLWFRSEVAPRD